MERRKIPIRYLGSREIRSLKMRAYWLAWLEQSKLLSTEAQFHTNISWKNDECCLLINEEKSKEIEKLFNSGLNTGNKFISQAGDLKIHG